MARKPAKNPEDFFRKDRERRKLNKAKKNIKRHRDERAPRRNDWLDLAEEDEETLENMHNFERVMPRDETDRRRKVEAVIEQVKLSSDDPADDEPVTDDGNGIVTEVSAGLCRVLTNGETLLCSLRGSLSAEDTGYTNIVAVGDRVTVQATETGKGVVEVVHPRNSQLARPDSFASHLQQVLVANLDQLLIVAAWRNPNIWHELIDRYLISAERSGIMPVLCVNKIDLATSFDEVDVEVQPYRDLGVQVMYTSAERGDGVDDLRHLLEGNITALSGLSGVGKSTLLSAVQPGFELRTGAVNEERGQGRHTTTQALMLPFGDDGFVVDTPGIREFGLVGLHQCDLQAYYPEIIALAGACRFADCTHQHEPDCAVRDAAERGDVSATRYDNYGKILVTLPE